MAKDEKPKKAAAKKAPAEEKPKPQPKATGTDVECGQKEAEKLQKQGTHRVKACFRPPESGRRGPKVYIMEPVPEE